MEYTEKQFIIGINRKERKVFHELYRRFYRQLVHFALKYLGDSDLAEDCVQELFVSVWERKETFLSYERLRNFLYLSLRNACLDLLKHQTVEKKYASYYKANETVTLSDNEEIIGEETIRLLFRIIDGLPPRCKEIFLLYMDGKKNEEIAVTLGIALDTVKNQKKKAMQVLRQRLGDFYFFLLFL